MAFPIARERERAREREKEREREKGEERERERERALIRTRICQVYRATNGFRMIEFYMAGL